MPNTFVMQNGLLVPNLPADPYFASVLALFKASKGLIDLKARSIFDTKTVPLTNTRQKFSAVSAEFDGTANKLLVSSNGTGGQVSDALAAPNNGWTMEGWLYVPSGGSTARTIMSNQSAGNAAGKFSLYITAANKLALITNIDRDVSTAAVPLNQWFHFGICKDAALSTNIWFGGQLDSNNTGNYGGNYSTAVGFGIGSRIDGSLPFLGSIDSIRVTNLVRYTTPSFTPAEFGEQ